MIETPCVSYVYVNSQQVVAFLHISSGYELSESGLETSGYRR